MLILTLSPCIPKLSYPYPKIKIILRNDKSDKYDNASLYQNILEFANLPRTTLEFRFTALGRWLMENNREFINDYIDSAQKTNISNRIANKRQRIQNCIDNLIKWNFLLIYKMVESEKNDLKTPLYLLTPLGKLVSLIVKSIFSNKEKEKIESIKEIIDIVNSIKEHNDSAVVIFIAELLNQLWQKDKISLIIHHFERLFHLELNKGNDFLSSLLGIKYFIYWFIINEEISFKILERLPNAKRKVILFNLKTEIEYYYQQNYLLKDDYFLNIGNLMNNGVIPSAYWENTRMRYINSFSKVVVPSYCDKCNSHRVFVIDIAEYLKAVIRAHGPYPSMHVSGNCMECNNFLSTHIMRMPFSSIVW